MCTHTWPKKLILIPTKYVILPSLCKELHSSYTELNILSPGCVQTDFKQIFSMTGLYFSFIQLFYKGLCNSKAN